ncbi:hypothetical protein RB195_006188 [Necator americanus]|uniref:Uncharacterized protein n=1 Tax=Necator americanus TaxID=51031 RepID=A0ABR1BUF7_NECAM
MRRCGSTPALTICDVYAPTSSYEEEEEVEAFHMDLEKFYREDHTFYKTDDKGRPQRERTEVLPKDAEAGKPFAKPVEASSIAGRRDVCDSVETEAVMEALDNQGVPTQNIKHQSSRTNADRIRRNMWMHHVDGLHLNLKKMFMRNGWVSDAPFTLNGTNISKFTSYVYLGPGDEHEEHLACDLLFNTTVLLTLTIVSETWAHRKQEENAVSVTERSTERAMLGVSHFTQLRDGIRSSILRQRPRIR